MRKSLPLYIKENPIILTLLTTPQPFNLLLHFLSTLLMAISTTNYSFIFLLFLTFSLTTQARVMTERNFLGETPVDGNGNANANKLKPVDNHQLLDQFEEDHKLKPVVDDQLLDKFEENHKLRPVDDDQILDQFEEDHTPFPTQQSENDNDLSGNTYYQEVQEAKMHPTEMDFNQGGSYVNRNSTETKDAVYNASATSKTTFFDTNRYYPDTNEQQINGNQYMWSTMRTEPVNKYELGGFNEDSYKKSNDFLNPFESKEQYFRNEQEMFVP